MTRQLVRFRANPDKVRVGVQRQEGGFIVTVSTRVGPELKAEAFATSAKKALVKALLAAEKIDLPGLDLSMGWTYKHPWLLDDP